MSTTSHYVYPTTVPASPATLADVEAFAQRWHQSQRAEWNRNGYTHDFMQHDVYNSKAVKERSKWFAVDNGPESNRSGYFMVRKADGLVFCIKAYGTPNLNKCLGHVSTLFTEVS